MLALVKTILLVLLPTVQPSVENRKPTSHTSYAEKGLIDHLLTGYSIHMRPVRNASNPVDVTFGFTLIQIVSLVERDQLITTKLWMRMKWRNELMAWDPRRWGNITQTRLRYVYCRVSNVSLLHRI